MSDPSSIDQRASLWVMRWLTAVLLVSAACAIGFGAFLAFSQEVAIEQLESPLVMAAARQLFVSPRELYGALSAVRIRGS